QPPYPYLNNYGDYWARSGSIVFMPIINYSFDSWGAALNGRTNRTSNIWNFLLPFYMSGVDFLHSQPNVDTDRIAAYGLSYGGVAALYTAAIDPRISTLIYSNFTMNSQSMMTSWVNVSMPIWFTRVCSMTNQVLPFLIAPRRMVWENGVGDFWNGFFEEYPTEIPDQVQQTYKNLGLEQRFQFIQHDGYHETRPWLFTVFYPKVEISDLNPSVISATSPMDLQITGSNFLTSPTVLLDNVPIATTFVDSTKLVAILPSGLSEGNHTVTIQNSDSYSTTTSLLVDRTPPVGMISNTDQILLSNHITLSLLFSDALSGVGQMRISETSFDFNSPWQPYQPSAEWFFSKGDGNKVIYTQFRDMAGNVSQVYTQSFLIDTFGPTGTLTINNGAIDTISRDVMLGLNADDHDGTGVSNLFLSNNGTTFEQPISMTNSVPWQLLDGMGAQTVYVRYQDNSGQFSSLISATVNLTNVNNLATGVSINNGDQFINNSDAVLTLIAPEYTSEMAIREFADKLVSASNANLDDVNAWIWEPYAVKRMWAFNDYGPIFPKRTIYVQFRDVSGDVSQTYFSNIYLDMTPPQGTVTSNVLQNQYTTSPNITLTLQASDDVSGVDKMRISTESDVVRVSLQTFSGTIPWTLDSTDGEKTIYVQYQDRANNLSEVYQTTVVLDTTPPQIKSAGWKEESGSQKLEFEVTDTLSGMDAMQISKDPSFAEALWMPFSSSFNSPQFASNQVVYVHFRDRAGNISAILSIQPSNRLFLPFVVR
ncbi:MAG: IPT/TIG domain-containing protein, partial [Saprospiraceae bacterium]